MLTEKPTKARTKGQRRARKRDLRDNPMALPQIPRREKDGRAHRTTAERDAAHETLLARCRRAGLPPTAANIRDMRAPWWGCEAGRVIGAADMADDQRLAYWDAIQHMRRVWQEYYRVIGSAGRYPKCMSILAPVDAMQADATSPPLDTRTDEEKQRSAVAAMMRVEGWLGRVASIAAGECKRVVLDDQPAHDAPGVIAGLCGVAEGLAGRI